MSDQFGVVTPLLRMALRTEPDVFLMRQRGREVAAAVGLEHQDQVRLATALSEIGRYLLGVVPTPARSEVLFSVDAARAVLAVEVTTDLSGRQERQLSEVLAVGRLVDTFDVERRDPATVIRLTRRIPPAAGPLTPAQLEVVRGKLGSSVARTPLEEMAEQNEQLLAALEQARAQRDELARLNDELGETNRGVLALYTQLSEELDETNRGVVALHAELDDRSVQLWAVSEAKTRFLANASHELRAPVTAIIGLARLLVDPSSDPLTDEQRQQLELIRGSARDLLALVNDLLDLAKAESGTIEPAWSDIELRVVFGQLRATVAPLATRPEVELVVDDPEPPAVIRSDEILLTQILRNLLHNGLKFTSQGQVRMTAESDGSTWTLRVSDTGIGIPTELQERIFEEFYQVPGKSSGGTGLGLPYARRLVTILGGTLHVESRFGEGSAFVVQLPVRSET